MMSSSLNPLKQVKSFGPGKAVGMNGRLGNQRLNPLKQVKSFGQGA